MFYKEVFKLELPFDMGWIPILSGDTILENRVAHRL